MTKKALITGITGQDGSYLAELLFGKRCEVDVMIGDSSKAQKSLDGNLKCASKNW